MHQRALNFYVILDTACRTVESAGTSKVNDAFDLKIGTLADNGTIQAIDAVLMPAIVAGPIADN